MRAVYFRPGYEKIETLTINDYSGEKHSAEGGRNEVIIFRCFLK